MKELLDKSIDEIREKFFQIETPQDIAELLETNYEYLKYYLYILPKERRYTSFEIRKKSGGTRKISTPSSALKLIQYKFNKILQLIYSPKPSTYGFTLKRSIVDNAKNHINKRYVLNIDLEDFFDTINFGRVRGMFMAKPFELNPKVSTVLAQICCHNNSIPQGAPTSPIISNMICSRMDSELQRLAGACRCLYTRYADDITFSTNLSHFPEILAKKITIDNGYSLKLGHELTESIRSNGFKINQGKIRLLTRNMRQEVTGITVNKFPNVRRKYIRQIRAMIHAWKKYGLVEAQKEFLYKYNKKSRNPHKNSPSFPHVVKGKIEYLSMVKGKDDKIYLRFRNQLKQLDPNLFNVPVNKLEELHDQWEKWHGVLERARSDKASRQLRQRRGYELQEILNSLFLYFEFPTVQSFTRNEGGEQIDGAFRYDGWHYLVECRWREQLTDISEVDGLRGKVSRSGRQTMGFFISINGWSRHVIPLLKQNIDKSIILMNGEDLESVLKEKIALDELLRSKIEIFNFKAEPFYSAFEAIDNKLRFP